MKCKWFACVILSLLSFYVIGQNNSVASFQALYNTFLIESDKNSARGLSLADTLVLLAEDLKIDSLRLKAYKSKAEILHQLGIYDEANQLMKKCIYITDQNSGLRSEKGELLFKMGLTFFETGEYGKAADYFRDSKKEFIYSRKYKDTIKANIELGLNLVGTNHIQSGITLMKNNIETGKKGILSKKELMVAYDNLSNGYYMIEKLDSSIYYQHKAKDIIMASPENILDKTVVYQHLTELHLEAGRYKEAQFYLDSALYFGTLLGSPNWMFDIKRDQSAIQFATGKYKEAYENLQVSNLMRDSIFQSDLSGKMAAFHALHQVDEKQLEITTLNASLVKSRYRFRLIMLVSASCVLTLLLLYVMRRFAFQKKLIENKEMYVRKLTQAQEMERKRIAQELHDSIGQNLIFVKNQLLQPDALQKEELKRSLDETLDEIRSISKNLYPNQLERYGLEAAVDNLADQVMKNFNIFVSADLQGIDNVLTENVKINFFRIIQEFINNTLKHANATSIRITTHHDNNQITLIVQDNGDGMDMDRIRKDQASTFGLLNMEERIKMLKGKVTIESAPKKGTKSTFSIPV